MSTEPVHALKRVLWLDPHFQIRSPAMQSMVRALPFMLEKGWQIEVWCLESDAVDARVSIQHLPRIPLLGPLELLWFWLIAFVKLHTVGRSWQIIHSSGPHMPGADFMSLHFHNRSWYDMQSSQPAGSWKQRCKRVLGAVSVLQESLAFNSRRWRVLLPVSEGLAARVRPFLPAGRKVRVLANALDETRFHAGVRALHRADMRAGMQFGESEFVFLFVSTGHYERKGFWPALQSLAACRQSGENIRFIVVGAAESGQVALKAKMDECCPGWREWVTLQPPCTDVERWYAAADAFLFPSRYETFSLVALEASACGLPLLITAYDGHEMYLKDGVNGCLLPWEQEAMTQRILQFMKVDRHHMQPGPAQSVNVCAYAEALDETYRELLACD